MLVLRAMIMGGRCRDAVRLSGPAMEAILPSAWATIVPRQLHQLEQFQTHHHHQLDNNQHDQPMQATGQPNLGLHGVMQRPLPSMMTMMRGFSSATDNKPGAGPSSPPSPSSSPGRGSDGAPVFDSVPAPSSHASPSFKAEEDPGAPGEGVLSAKKPVEYYSSTPLMMDANSTAPLK